MQVRRNALNLQLVVDPLSQEGLELGRAALSLFAQGGAVRIGALFTCELSSSDVPFSDMALGGQFVRWVLSLQSWACTHACNRNVMPCRFAHALTAWAFSCEETSPPGGVWPPALPTWQHQCDCIVERGMLWCRLFLTMHKGFGRSAAWQLWAALAEQALPEGGDDYDEDPSEQPTLKEVTSEMLLDTFEKLWDAFKVQSDFQCSTAWS